MSEETQEVVQETESKPVFIDFTRLLQLHGDVCEDLSREFQAAILNLHAEKGPLLNEAGEVIKDADDKPVNCVDEPIFILLNTHGGDAYEGFAMFDMMNLLPNEKFIICQGKVMSAGLILLASGTTRLSMPNTIFMIHQMATTIPPEMSDPQKIKQGLISTEEMNEHMLRVLALNCNLDYETVKQIAEKETYFTADEALKWGFIDGIIGSKSEEVNEEERTDTPPHNLN